MYFHDLLAHQNTFNNWIMSQFQSSFQGLSRIQSLYVNQSQFQASVSYHERTQLKSFSNSVNQMVHTLIWKWSWRPSLIWGFQYLPPEISFCFGPWWHSSDNHALIFFYIAVGKWIFLCLWARYSPGTLFGCSRYSKCISDNRVDGNV